MTNQSSIEIFSNSKFLFPYSDGHFLTWPEEHLSHYIPSCFSSFLNSFQSYLPTHASALVYYLQCPICACITTVLDDSQFVPRAYEMLQCSCPLTSVIQCPLTFMGYSSSDSFPLCLHLLPLSPTCFPSARDS